MSTESRDDSLPARAEALLDGWPVPSRGALEWEDAATRAMDRVRETTIGSTEDALLADPLAEEPGEGRIDPPPPEEEPGLAAIARAVVAAGAPIPAAIGARSASAEEAEEVAESRPPAPPSRRMAAVKPARSLAEAPAVQAVHEAHARSELPAQPTVLRRDTLSTVALGAAAALALAAGAMLYVAMKIERPQVVAQASASAPVTAASPAPAEPAVAASAVARNDEPTQPLLHIDDLPPGSPMNAPAPPSKQGTLGGAKDSLAFRVNSSPKGSNKLVLEERTEEPAAAPLAEAPKAKKVELQGEPEPGVPPQPSLGALQGALGSVMTGARSCLAGQDEGSRATVTFAPTGRAKSVTIAGPAAGTPAEGCVRSALLGARVPPFSDTSFSTSLTIRPP